VVTVVVVVEVLIEALFFCSSRKSSRINRKSYILKRSCSSGSSRNMSIGTLVSVVAAVVVVQKEVAEV
jgi:hypothetical protein